MLIGKLVVLRGLELSDVDELMKYWNLKEVKRYLLAIGPNAKEEEIEWIKGTWERRQKGQDYVFGIVVKEENLYIGNVEIGIRNQINRRGYAGIAIFNPSYWGRGFGTEAIQLLIEYGFKNLNLNSVELEVFETNTRAQRCYEKVGFKEVGRRRQAQFFEGRYIDSIVMDILSSEWASQ